MSNGYWHLGGGSNPLLQDFFAKNIGKLYALASLGSCHVTSSRQGVNENLQFSRFLKHVSEKFRYFIMKSIWLRGLIEF